MDGYKKFQSQSVVKNQHGFALLLSLLIMLLLVVIIMELNFQARADLRAAGNFRDDLKAFYLARSAVAAGEAILKEDLRISNKYDGLDELWAYPVPEYPLGDGTLAGGITDEQGKININSLLETGGKVSKESPRKKQLQLLFEHLQLKPELVDPIVDWIDSNSEPEQHGAEADFYQQMTPSYSIKDGPLDTLQELHMIKGISDEVYNKISPYLTVYGDGKINVNTADILVIRSLAEGIEETIARRIVDGRPYQDRNKYKENVADESVKTKLLGVNWIETRSNVFSILAEGRVQNTRKIVRAVVDRRTPAKLLYFKVE